MAIAALDKEEAEKAGGVWNVVGVTGVQGRMRLRLSDGDSEDLLGHWTSARG